MIKLNNMTASAATLLLVTGMAVSSVQASDVNYNYIEGRYIVDAEDNNIDGDGFRIGGSYRLNSDLYAFGSYETLDFDFNNDVDILEFGAGYIYPLNTQWDANFTLSFMNVDVSSNTINNDDNGFSITGGVRGMFTSKIEGRAKVSYQDVTDSDTFITLGGDYFFTPNLSAGVEIDLAGDVDKLSIGGRYYFK